MCWYHKNAPILILTKTWKHAALFSPELNRCVFPTNNQLKICGFRLFNKKIFFNRETSSDYKEILTYKYNGNFRCLALAKYKAWPTGMVTCCKVDCTLH
jgi:hypothetical protein